MGSRPLIEAAVDLRAFVPVDGDETLFARSDTLHKVRDGGKVARPADDVEMGMLLKEGAHMLLGHAAQDSDDEIGIPSPEGLERAEPGVDPVFGMLSHAAGHEEHKAGVMGIIGEGVAAVGENRAHKLRVQLVHLTPENLEVGRPLH